MKFISAAVHISSGCGKPHSSYLYRLQFHVSPSGDMPAPSSCWYSWLPLYPCTTFDTHHWEIFLHGCPPKKPQGLSLLGQIPDALAHWNTSVTRVSQHPAKPQCQELTVCTLNDTPGIFQGYWESEQEVSWFKNGSPMLRDPAETRGQHAI